MSKLVGGNKTWAWTSLPLRKRNACMHNHHHQHRGWKTWRWRSYATKSRSSFTRSICLFTYTLIEKLKRNLAPAKRAIPKRGGAFFQRSLFRGLVSCWEGNRPEDDWTTYTSLCAANWSAGSKYEHKRSKTLLKVKTFYDEDLYAVVLKEVTFIKGVNPWDACRDMLVPWSFSELFSPNWRTVLDRPIESITWTCKWTGGHCSGPCRWQWPCGRDVRRTPLWNSRQTAL